MERSKSYNHSFISHSFLLTQESFFFLQRTRITNTFKSSSSASTISLHTCEKYEESILKFLWRSWWCWWWWRWRRRRRLCHDYMEGAWREQSVFWLMDGDHCSILTSVKAKEKKRVWIRKFINVSGKALEHPLNSCVKIIKIIIRIRKEKEWTPFKVNGQEKNKWTDIVRCTNLNAYVFVMFRWTQHVIMNIHLYLKWIFFHHHHDQHTIANSHAIY